MSSTATMTSPSSSSASPSRQQQANASLKYAQQAEKLSLRRRGSPDEKDEDTTATSVLKAHFVTPRDAVLETGDGHRLPAVPVHEAEKLNALRDRALHEKPTTSANKLSTNDERGIFHEAPRYNSGQETSRISAEPSTSRLDTAGPPATTHPLFPPLPIYGPASPLRTLQCQFFRAISSVLSLAFLAVIVIGACLTSIPALLRRIALRLALMDPDAQRKYHKEEVERYKQRKRAEQAWKRQQYVRRGKKIEDDGESQDAADEAEKGTMESEYPPLEGGPDKLVCDVGYYARRVGLDVEAFKVQTEDGFIIDLWHVYNPQEYTALSDEERSAHQPDVFYHQKSRQVPSSGRRYPVLLVHGLLQSAGAYCSNDDDSLAFYLCKAGYDVWLGNNRCGFDPQHTTLSYSDPRMWAWNIRHMGVLDLPALVSRVLYETGFEKLGLVCHSQGTTETLVALSKDQRPDLGDRISVFCALAPAAYAGPLIKKGYFRFMGIISPSVFRLFFGIHSFIPLMMAMHSLLPGVIYGSLGYLVFSYLFDWTDVRWDRGLRDRFFLFAPVYVSAESMRWWLGRDGFAKHKCILATKEQGILEEEEDRQYEAGRHDGTGRGDNPWYGPGTPPFALWVAGSDDLVDGRRLIRRLQNGREPHVRLVHTKVIEEYEHLDVLWAMDAIEQVGSEVRDVIYRTMSEHDKTVCRVPKGVVRRPAS